MHLLYSGIADFVRLLGRWAGMREQFTQCFQISKPWPNDPLRRYVRDLLIFNRKITRERRWFALWRYQFQIQRLLDQIWDGITDGVVIIKRRKSWCLSTTSYWYIFYDVDVGTLEKTLADPTYTSRIPYTTQARATRRDSCIC